MLLFVEHQAHIHADVFGSANWLNLCLNTTGFMGRGLSISLTLSIFYLNFTHSWIRMDVYSSLDLYSYEYYLYQVRCKDICMYRYIKYIYKDFMLEAMHIPHANLKLHLLLWRLAFLYHSNGLHGSNKEELKN